MNRFDARLGVAIVATALVTATATALVVRATSDEPRADPRVAQLEKELADLRRERDERLAVVLHERSDPPPPAEAPLNQPFPPQVAPPAPIPNACDEVTCVLEDYGRACCERFKPERTPARRADSLDRDAIKRGMAHVKPYVEACGSTGKHGIVKVTVKVPPSGNAPTVSVKSADDAELGECVAHAVRGASFAETAYGGSFSYPYVF